MNFCIQTIFDKNLFEGAKLVAGARGVTNLIEWVNCMEILDTPDSLQRGELLVTTGYRLDNESEYADFPERAYKRGISGIAIQPGYYISRIPAYIIAAGDRLGLPIIELPATLTFSSILHTLIRNIIAPQTDNRDRDYEKLLHSLESDLQPPDNGITAVVCFAENQITVESQQPLLLRISSIFETLCIDVKLYTENTVALFSASLRTTITIDLLQAEISTEIGNYSSVLHRQVFCGLSRIAEPELVPAAFNRGYSIVKTLAAEGAWKGACSDEGLSFFRWCRYLSENRETAPAAGRILHPLQIYDAEHERMLMRTLRLYLAARGQITVCARILGIHRKTMEKRLSRITELCSLSPESCSGGMSFALALAEYDYFLS
jgi:hypothetical protein